MQVTQTLSEGLKREYRVVVTSDDLAKRADGRLDDLKGRVNINGFRPGKVPTSHVKRLYGKAVMAEAVEAIIEEANTKIANDNNYKFAIPPKPKLPEDEAAAMEIFNGKADLDYTVSFEIIPSFEISDLNVVNVTKPVTPVTEEDITKMLENIAASNKSYAEKTGASEKDDSLKIDFAGSIDGVAFDGGTAEDAQLVLGSNTFIPGFEDQLIGKKAGDEVEVNVTFPADYNAAHLAGKAAVFAVKVKAVEAPKERAIDDELAKMVGFDSLEKLRDAVSDRIKNEYEVASKRKAKRSLLDGLDAKYAFDLPPTLVEQEFNMVWGQVTNELEQNKRTFADEDTTEEKAREDYMKIAQRRVRLGLIPADIGEKNNITVTDEELTRAVIEQVRQYPGQEKQIYDYLRSNQQALASFRAPLFEEKVVDHLFSQVTIQETSVSKEELFKEEE